jgi:hypothetical protein
MSKADNHTTTRVPSAPAWQSLRAECIAVVRRHREADRHTTRLETPEGERSGVCARLLCRTDRAANRNGRVLAA